MYYVIIVKDDGQPGRLYGPMPYEDCVEKVMSLACLDSEYLALINKEAGYDYADGSGGIYIVQSED